MTRMVKLTFRWVDPQDHERSCVVVDWSTGIVRNAVLQMFCDVVEVTEEPVADPADGAA